MKWENNTGRNCFISAAISDLIEAHRKKIETVPQGTISEIRKEMRDVLSLSILTQTLS